MLIHAQTSDLERINQILNHPDVFPFVSWGMENPFEFEPEDLNGLFFLMPEDRNGVFIIEALDMENAEVHSAFLPGHRGKNAIDTAWEGLEWIFTATSITNLWTKVPNGNRRAEAMCRVMGWEPMGSCGTFDLWRMDILRWTSRAPFQDVSGGLYDRALVVGTKMLDASQPRKAVDFYNTLAIPAGWAPAKLESADPVRISLGENLILLQGEKGSIPKVENDPCLLPQ